MARISKYQSSDNAIPFAVIMWKGVRYLRLSKKDGDNDEEGKLESDSISNQRYIIQDYLSENPDIEIVEEYIDDGYSGLNFNRPGFMKMIEDIRTGKVNCVIVKDLSRFGRNYLEAGNYLDIFFPIMNVRFIAINDTIDSYLYPSSLNNISASFKNVMNEEYSRDISNKIRSTFVAKRESGEYICGFPLYGYVRDPNDHGKLLLDNEAAAIVKQIFEWFSEGYSYRGITFRLNELGVPSPNKYKSLKYSNYRRSRSSGLWTIPTIKGILSNQMYTGDLVQGKYEKINHKVKKIRRLNEDRWVIIEAHHEAIVDKELFLNVQKLMHRDMRISPTQKELGLFSGFLKCADCGRQMVKKKASREKAREKYHYYTCATYDLKTKSACTRHTMRSDKLESVVFTVITKYIDLAVDMEHLLKKIHDSPKKKAASNRLSDLLHAKEKEREKIEGILLDLYPDLKSGIISRSQYLLLKQRYDSEIKEINQAISNIRQTLNHEIHSLDGENDFIRHFREYRNIDKLTREVLIALVDVIYIHEGGAIEIVFKFQDAFLHAAEYINNNKEVLEQNIPSELEVDSFKAVEAHV